MSQSSGGGENRGISPFVLVAVGFALLVFGLVGGYTLNMSGGSGEEPGGIALPVAAEKAYAKAAENYLCPCGSCAEALAECVCETAAEVKLDTRKRLAQEDQVAFSDVTWILENIHEAQPMR